MSPEDEPACAYAHVRNLTSAMLRDTLGRLQVTVGNLIRAAIGDGTTRVGDRQTAVPYCAVHAELVKRLFVTCDERSLVATFVAP